MLGARGHLDAVAVPLRGPRVAAARRQQVSAQEGQAAQGRPGAVTLRLHRGRAAGARPCTVEPACRGPAACDERFDPDVHLALRAAAGRLRAGRLFGHAAFWVHLHDPGPLRPRPLRQRVWRGRPRDPPRHDCHRRHRQAARAERDARQGKVEGRAGAGVRDRAAGRQLGARAPVGGRVRPPGGGSPAAGGSGGVADPGPPRRLGERHGGCRRHGAGLGAVRLALAQGGGLGQQRHESHRADRSGRGGVGGALCGGCQAAGPRRCCGDEGGVRRGRAGCGVLPWRRYSGTRGRTRSGEGRRRTAAGRACGTPCRDGRACSTRRGC
mmetsp:Transcript_17156/g.44711  ORF Transcript_17156/g.44711 Transcript_17156/m.44711 type:complete len:325 (-) Transcript_17156:61-1035(-)